MLNGRRVDGKAVIENGDIITIGNIPLKFECDDALSQRAELNFAHRCRRHRIQLHTACLSMSKQSAPFI